ncbi:hypothetical protein BDF14DRAFT_1771037 [Spinellus fusiger]|nr:hypothetical protein BDF14DRAFT_1771037 [Spinellus fusiger]
MERSFHECFGFSVAYALYVTRECFVLFPILIISIYGFLLTTRQLPFFSSFAIYIYIGKDCSDSYYSYAQSDLCYWVHCYSAWNHLLLIIIVIFRKHSRWVYIRSTFEKPIKRRKEKRVFSKDGHESQLQNKGANTTHANTYGTLCLTCTPFYATKTQG